MRAWTLAVLMAITLAPMPAMAQVRGRPRTFVDLSYPAEALTARVAGTVTVRVTTDESFRVVEAEPLSGPAVLRPAVLANVRQWTLAPGPRTDIVVYRFEIDNASCNDDSRSLFRLAHRNLALITACSAPGRGQVLFPSDEFPPASYGTVPRYPRIAKGTLTAGVVVLELSTDANGRVTEARALNAERCLTETAVDHAKTWQVRPTSARATLVRRGVVVVYEFTLDNDLCSAEDFDYSTFQSLGTDHVRLSVCGWIPMNVAGQSGDVTGQDRK
jgi:TonB family protein